MKKLILLLTLSTLSTSLLAEESSWLDTAKSFFAEDEVKEQSVAADAASSLLSTDGLVGMLTSSLDVNDDQASGGMGAIFNYVKDNVSMEQFGQLSESLPGVDGLISQMPDTTNLDSKSSEGFGGLLEQASQYSGSLKSVNDVKKQFEALGLTPEMINSFVTTAQSYLDTEQGQQAITDGLGKLLG